MKNTTIYGNVGRDPRCGTGKTDWAFFSVAVKKKGEEKPEWINCQCFGDAAAGVQGAVTKGVRLKLTGELKDSNNPQFPGKVLVVETWSIESFPKKKNDELSDENLPF